MMGIKIDVKLGKSRYIKFFFFFVSFLYLNKFQNED